MKQKWVKRIFSLQLFFFSPSFALYSNESDMSTISNMLNWLAYGNNFSFDYWLRFDVRHTHNMRLAICDDSHHLERYTDGNLGFCVLKKLAFHLIDYILSLLFFLFLFFFREMGITLKKNVYNFPIQHK